MPEGHTIHRLAARHAALFAGDKILAGSPQGRLAEGAALLSGTVLDTTEAYGKHLLHHYEAGILHVHLGLYGTFADGEGEPPPPVGQVRLRLTSDRHWLDVRGPAACEVLSLPEVEALRARLGLPRAEPGRLAGRTPTGSLAHIAAAAAAICFADSLGLSATSRSRS